MKEEQLSFWNTPLATLYTQLGTSVVGLTIEEAAKRATQYGPNLLRTPGERPWLLQFLARFANPLIILLLVASGISALTGDVASFVIISAIVLLSVVLDFLQEYQAGRAAQRLRQSVAVRSTVLRDGKPTEVPLASLVPGDVVLLAAGDLVPADGRILDAKDLFLNQSLLTGEPFPAEKGAGDMAATTEDLAKATNAAFMGSSVVSGTARLMVCRTGAACALGAIARSLASRAPPNAFEIGTRRFGLLIMRLTLLLVLFVLLVNALSHRPLLESFVFAVALAVGLTPELLPMVVTVTLSRGALRMARKQVIVKRLPAIHNLGSMDVLCTDKTGTLTEARIRLERHVDNRGRESEQVLALAYLNSFFETGLRSPLDTAILEHTDIDVSAWRKLDELPFDFQRRRVSVLVESKADRMLIVKGAPENILLVSTQYDSDGLGTLAPLDAPAAARIRRLYEDLASEGFRVLGIAWRKVPLEHSTAMIGDETELVFAGLAAFFDPPKASVFQALASLASSGVAVKIVTGDNELVTRHVCGQIGLPIRGVLTGEQIQQLDESALRVQAETANLFCRVTPAQKNRIVLALKAHGHTVGFLGDGVNDAPSLHSADVGISVDSAVDVAKEAAELILLRQDLNALYDGVIEGRRTFGNIMKYIMMGTSSNFGNMFSMAGATLLLPFLPMLPVQILLNNLLYDISEIAIPMDRVDRTYLMHPRQWDMDFIRTFMWMVGPVSSLFDFLTFYVLLRVFHAHEALFHTGWFIESVATQVLVIFVIRTRHNPFRSHPAALLIAASVAVVAAALLLPYTSLGSYFGLVPPPTLFFALLAFMTVSYLAVVELVKHWFFEHFSDRPGGHRV